MTRQPTLDTLNTAAGLLHDDDDAGALDALARLVEAERLVRVARIELVCELRNVEGYSWARVADVLGVSKQAAMKVYGAAAADDFRRELRRRPAPATPVATVAQLAPATPVALPAVDVPLDLAGDEFDAAPELVYVVPCGAAKLDHRAPARELYTGSHFQRTLRIVEAAARRDGAAVRILSAKHGLVDPDRELEPYDVLVADLDDATRLDLELTIRGQLEGLGAREVRTWLPKAYTFVMTHAVAMVPPARRPMLRGEFAGARGIGDQRARLAELEASLGA